MKRERGAAAVVTVIALLALIAVVGLVLNAGSRFDTRAELQNAADAAALAAAHELDGTLAPIEAGRPAALAIDYAGRHTSGASVPVAIGAADVQLGRWDPLQANPALAFTPMTVATPEDAWSVNAVRVRVGREEVRGSALPVVLGAYLGDVATQDVAAEAVAVNGGPMDILCPTMPFAFFDCGFFENYELTCGTLMRMTASMSPDPSDTVGFTSLSLDPASTDVYRDILAADPNDCTDHAVSVGEPILISNGTQLGALCADLQAKIGLVSTAPIVHDSCPPRFNQAHPIVGIATFTLVQVVCTGNPKFIEFEFMCNQVDPNADRVGSGFYGTGPLQPRLVR